MVEMNPWVILLIYATVAILGFASGRSYERARGRRIKRQLEVPIYKGAGEGLETLEAEFDEAQLGDMDREEATMLISATQHFVDCLKEQFDLQEKDFYEPTENEQAIADGIEDDTVAWEKTIESSYPEV